MKLYNPNELDQEYNSTGFLMLLYGATGVGKSVSTMQSAPDPILYLMTESRDPRKFLKEAGRPGVKIKFAFYEKWDELLEFFANTDNFAPYKTVVIDSLTFLSTGMCIEIEDESWDAVDAKTKSKKPIVMRTKMSQEGYGGLASSMLRFTKLCGELTKQGKVVICLALMEENPNYKRELQAGPSLDGKKYPRNMGGFFDMIGMVVGRTDANGENVYPPGIVFSGDETFMHKKYGNVSKSIFDIKRILEKAAEVSTTTDKSNDNREGGAAGDTE